MIRDITIGQYYPSESVIHKLDPRVKLFATMLFVISLFLEKGILSFVIATVALVLVITISKVPLSYILRGLKPIVFLLVFSCVLNMLFTKGDTVWFQWHFLVLSNIYGSTAALSGRWFVPDDIYHDTKPVDRWY